MSRIIDELKRTDHKRYLGGLDFFKYIGPGLLVTVGSVYYTHMTLPTTPYV